MSVARKLSKPSRTLPSTYLLFVASSSSDGSVLIFNFFPCNIVTSSLNKFVPSNSLLSPLCAYFESLSVLSLVIFDLTNSETDNVDGYFVFVKLSLEKSIDLLSVDSPLVTSLI